MVTINVEALIVPNTIIDTLIEPGGIYNGVSYENDATLVDYYTAANGCDSIVTTNIFVEVDRTFSQFGIEELNIFPNPASNQLYFQMDLKESIDLQYEVYNTFGQKINHLSFQSTNYSAGNHELDINVTNLPSGAYFINFQTGKGNVVKRFVVTR